TSASGRHATRRTIPTAPSRAVDAWPGGSVAAHAHAAVDDELGAGDEARLVGSEEERGGGGIAAVAHEAERDARLALLEQLGDVAAGALLRQPRLDHRRVHLAGDDRVHADAVPGVLHGDDPAE